MTSASRGITVVLDRLAELVDKGSFDFVISTEQNPQVVLARMEMAPPATKEQLKECEGALGTALPPSYRDFLQRWNGGRLWVVYENGQRVYEALRLFSTKDLIEENLWLRSSKTRDLSTAALLWFGETWGWYHLFDLASNPDDPPVVGGDEHAKPKVWLAKTEAVSFIAFLGRMLDLDGGEFWIPNNRAGRMEHILGVLKLLVVQAPWPANFPTLGWVTVDQTVKPGADEAELAAVEAALGTRVPQSLAVLLRTWNGAELYRISQEGRELWSVRVHDTTTHGTEDTLVFHDTRFLVVAETEGYRFALDLSAAESPVYAIADGAPPMFVAPSLADFLWTLRDEKGRRFWVGP